MELHICESPAWQYLINISLNSLAAVLHINKSNAAGNRQEVVHPCFRGISRLGSAFIFLQWFKLAHISIHVTSLHKWKKQGINHKFFNRRSISCNTTHRQSYHHLQAQLTGVKHRKANTRSEKVNNLKTAMKKTTKA